MGEKWSRGDRIFALMDFILVAGLVVLILFATIHGSGSEATPEPDTVATETPPEPVPEPEPEPSEEQVLNCVNEEELEMLALVIYAEAGADYISDRARQMVGEVVLNRVASPHYPDTMYEVLTQPYQYGRFHWTGLVWPERAKYECEAHAVQRAYDMAAALLSGSVARLLPEDTIYQAEFEQGREVVEKIDGIYFCR